MCVRENAGNMRSKLAVQVSTTLTPGPATLTVRTGKVREDEDEVFVEFGDTGPGVPPEIKDRIFEPFFTTKPVGEGTGLGLDISWRIVVKKHHGDISLESTPGDTRFRVRLPVAWQDAEDKLT